MPNLAAVANAKPIAHLPVQSRLHYEGMPIPRDDEMSERSWKTKNPGPASYSPCLAYRYRLERLLGAGSTAAFIMVNPSTATEDTDDQTILMVQNVCATFGIGRAIIGNMFAYRSKDVTDLAKVDDPVGPDNDKHLTQIAAEAEKIIVAWGVPEKLPESLRHRWRDVVAILDSGGKPLHCLKHLARNHPRHPQILIHENPLPLWMHPL